MDYWRECIAEAAEDCGATLSEEQINCIASWAEGAHDNYSQATGLDVADRNWRAQNDKEQEKRGVEAVLSYIEDRVSTVDNGPAQCFDYMSTNQRLAMHEIFQARSFLRKKGIGV